MKTIKLHAKRQRPRQEDLKGVVRISEDAERTLWELKNKTGLSLRYIASELILQAAPMVQIVESE